MPLTDTTIRNAKSKDKPYKLSDGGGLFISVQPNGGKWWRFKYRFIDKEKLLSLGVYPDVSLAQARERRDNARKALADGKDPSFLKQEAKRHAVIKIENTFEAIFKEWHEKKSPGWTPRYARNVIMRMGLDIIPKLGKRPIAEITAPELLDVLRVIEARGSLDIAHRAQQVCGQIFLYAIATGRAERNPALDLRGALKVHKKKHYPHLTADELPEFFRAMEVYTRKRTLLTTLALRLLILTFVRTGELRAATWNEINLEKAEWRIPATRMKMRQPHIVPLSRQAIVLLQELMPLTGHWQYLFPNQHHPAKCMSENTILGALKRMNYQERTTGHGFRAMASTILNEHSFRPDIIERQLAHKEANQVRACYNHAQYLEERRKMMQWWADFLDEHSAKEPKVIMGGFGRAV